MMDQLARDESRARALARVLDNAVTIPGTKIRVGLDALIGLIPGGGDVVGAALSSVIVLLAMRDGVPPAVLWRMVANVAIDTAVGAIPVLGDLFDVAWRANARNADLLDRWIADPKKTTTRNRSLGILVVVVMIALIVGILAATALLLRALFSAF